MNETINAMAEKVISVGGAPLIVGLALLGVTAVVTAVVSGIWLGCEVARFEFGQWNKVRKSFK